VIPRALRSRPRAMARPARPLAEVVAVRAAAELVSAETGLTAADPIASIIAARVITVMQAYLAEGVDPLLEALGNARRRVEPTPFDMLATDAQIDTLALFVTARVERLQARHGRGLTTHEEQAECRELWAGVQRSLWRRYINCLRKRG